MCIYGCKVAAIVQYLLGKLEILNHVYSERVRAFAEVEAEWNFSNDTQIV
jgi:hypothetical protein